MRIPDYQPAINFQSALIQGLSSYALIHGIVWPPSKGNAIGNHSVAMAKLMFGDALKKTKYSAFKSLLTKHYNDELASSSFCSTCWLKLLSEHRDGLKQACIEYKLPMLTYPSVSECLAFYSFFQCPPKRRIEKARALVGIHVGYRPYWLSVSGIKHPILRFNLEIQQHKDDPTVILAKESILLHSESVERQLISEHSFGFVVPDSEFVHIYLLASEQRRHKHYILNNFSTRLDSGAKIERMNGTAVVASSRGNFSDNVYLSGRGTILQSIDSSRAKDFAPQIIDLNDPLIDEEVRQKILLYEGGYITNWDDAPANSVNKAIASELCAKATALDETVVKLKEMAERLTKVKDC